jgi:alpha-L-fucosidase
MADDRHDHMSEGRWLPAECDTKLRGHWDWHGPKDPLISLPRLMDIYYWSVGRGCNLLLNAAPDTRGLIHEADAARLTEMGKEIRRRFGRPLSNLTDARRDGLSWTWQPKEPLLIDHLVFAEDIAKGEHIRKYRLVARTSAAAAPVTLAEGSSVGHKAICRFTPVKVVSVTLEVLEADGEVSLRSLEFHHAAGNP